jgi:hypothetical protein
MSFGSQPTPPDPSLTSNAQQQFNIDAAKQQNQVNSYNQQNPYGSMSYVADPNSPSGYSLNTQYSAPQQGLYNTQVGTQQLAGNTAQNLLRNTASMYSQAPDITKGTQGIASYLNQMQQAYQQPIFNQQQSNLDAQLRNQGLTPGSEAYNNAQNLLARNQGDVQNQYLTQNEGQAFNQAVQQYQLPLQTIGSLYGASQPTGPNFQQTPTAQIQPPNYQGAAQANYQAQLNNYQQQNANLAKLGAAGIGLIGAPFTGGTSLAGGLGSIFGGGGTAGVMNYGGQSWPSYS